MRLHLISGPWVGRFGYTVLAMFLLNCPVVMGQPVIDRVFEDGFQTLTRSIRITPGAVVLTSSSVSKSLTAEVLDLNNEVVVAPVDWSSSNPEIVSVENGALTSLVSTGSVVITASSAGATDAQIVVVVAEPGVRP